MYGKMNIFTYLLFPVSTLICVIDSIVLSYLANIRCQHCKTFKKPWKRALRKWEDKKIYNACKPNGFDLSPYGVCTASLELRICDDYMHNTVVVIL